MSKILEAPVLQVDANIFDEVDTTKWVVFTICRASVTQGRRLQNPSEGKEMLLSASAASQPQTVQYPRDVAEALPQLLGSVDSVADEEAVGFTETTPVDTMRPRIQRQESCGSSRSCGQEHHITSDELEKMVVSIMENKVPLNAPATKIIFPKNQQARFFLGGSSGSDEQSFKNRDLDAASNGNEKTVSTSFAISDTKRGYNESAIDDDDGDWEDESAEEGSNSMAEKDINFQRIDSSTYLPSRQSLITLMLSESTAALSRSREIVNDPSLVALPKDSDEAPLMMKTGTACAPSMRHINEIPRSAAQPINVTAAGMHYQAATSPRTTRRKMLANEMTKSLRSNLLRERRQLSQITNAVSKRWRSSNDVANLNQEYFDSLEICQVRTW